MITPSKITLNFIDDLQSEMQGIADQIEEIWQDSTAGDLGPDEAAAKLNAVFDKIKILFHR